MSDTARIVTELLSTLYICAGSFYAGSRWKAIRASSECLMAVYVAAVFALMVWPIELLAYVIWRASGRRDIEEESENAE